MRFKFYEARTTRLSPSRGQMFEAKAEANAKCLRPRPRPKLWGRGQNFGLKTVSASWL